MKRNFILFLLFITSLPSFTQPVPVGELSGTETYFTGFNENLYFASKDSILVSDTTSKTISLLIDLPEPVIADGEYASEFGANTRGKSIFDFPRFPTSENYIFFITRTSPDSVSLWISDGISASGTMKIGTFGEIYYNTGFKGSLFFIATKAGFGLRLWKVDENGVLDVFTDLEPELSGGLTFREPEAGTDYLYFIADDGTTGNELYKTDGTEAGTMLTFDFTPGSQGSNFKELTFSQGDLFFTDGDSIWVYDNMNINYVSSAEEDHAIGQMAAINGYLIYEQVSVQDGFTDIFSTQGGFEEEIYLVSLDESDIFIKVGSELFFYEDADYYIDAYYKTDGTPGGTERFLYPIQEYYTADRFLGMGDYLFHTLSEGPIDFAEGTYELSQSDLTTDGTVMVKDLFPGNQSYNLANNFTNVDGVLFFTTGDEYEFSAAEPAILYYYVPVPPIITSSRAVETIEFSLYPNPVESKCMIKTNTKGTITVLNMFGTSVLQKDYNSNETLDLSSLETGIYFIKLISDDNKTSFKKIVRE